jgi:ParB/RepB/Spo0J family partition protein
VTESTYQELPLERLVASANNPRRVFDEAAQADLVASIRARGILTPLIARPVNGHFEIIAGERRYRAAREIGLATVPVIIRDVDDAAALEDATVENLQRADIHPLDEADSYRALMALDPAYTPEAIAAKVGKAASYVYQRLKLADLVPTVKTAFLADAITAGHATLIARLAPEQQPAALEACFETLFRVADQHDKRALVSLAKFKQWIHDNAKIDITAPETADLFPGLQDQLLQLPGLQELLEVSTAWCAGKDVPAGVLPRSQYERILGKGCKSARPAVVVHGDDDRAEIVQVCIDKKCAVHRPPKVASPKAEKVDYKAQEEQRRLEQERWQKIRPLALQAVAAAAKDKPCDAAQVLETLFEQAFRAVDEIKALVGGAITLKNIGQAVAVGEAMYDDYSQVQFERVAKKWRVDLGAIERSLDASPKPEPAASKKPTAKRATPKKPAAAKKPAPAKKASGKKR